MMESIFQVAKLVQGPPGDVPTGKPYFVLETMFTSDGMRTRICEGRYATWQTADDVCKQRRDGTYPKQLQPASGPQAAPATTTPATT